MGILDLSVTDKELTFTNNDFATITDEDALAARLEAKLKMFEGEWFLDATLGINWPDALSTKPFRVDDFAAIIRKELGDDPAVTSITSLVITPNNSTRELTITFEVASDVGLVEGGVKIT